MKGKNGWKGKVGWGPVLLLLVLPILLQPAPALECPLSPGPRGPQSSPHISGDMAVWLDLGSGDVILYNFTDGNETVLTSGGGKMGPLVSGDLVIWLENALPPYSLVLLDRTSGSTTTLSTDAWTPAISGSRIAWLDYTSGSGLPSISLYDAGSGLYTAVAADPHDQVQSTLSGNRVAWVNGSDPANPIDIFTKDLTTGTETLVTESPCSTPFLCVVDPIISGERIVWSDLRDDTDSDIYLFDLANPPPVKLTGDGSSKNQPFIDGDLVAWVDYPDVILDNITDADPPASISSGGVNNGPRISGNRIIWEKDQMIYLSTIGSSDPCPLASFGANLTSGTAPLTVQFTDTSVTNSTHSSWRWDFGDGAIAYDEEEPEHTYAADGSYTVSLTVGNTVGRDYAAVTGYIRIGPVPMVSFTADQTYGITPLAVQFTDTSSGSPTGWAWDLNGDGMNESTTLPDPSYTYSTPGIYNVTLFATNDFGTGSGTIPGFIQALNGMNLTSTTDLDGLSVRTAGGRQEITLDTTRMVSVTFDPGTPASFSFVPPPSSGWQRMTFSSSDGIGFARDAGGIIRGNLSSCTLESRELVPGTFVTDVGNNLPLSYSIQLGAYPPLAMVNATVWEGAMPADTTDFREALAATSRDFTSVLGIAYTLDFVPVNLIGVQSATLNLSVSSSWVQKYGNQNNIAVVRLGDNQVNQTLNPSATFTDAGLDYFTVPSSGGLSRFALVSAMGSSNLIQMGSRLATQMIQGSGGRGAGSSDQSTARDRTSWAQPTAAAQPAQAPAVPTFYGEGPVDTTTAGITREAVIIASADQGARLAIGSGVSARDGAGNPLMLVTVQAAPAGSVPPIPEGERVYFTGMVYDIGPDGSTFDPPATVSFVVPEYLWDPDTGYSVRSYSAEAGSWEAVPTSVDTGNRIVSGSVSHLCLFGLFASPPAVSGTLAPGPEPAVATPGSQPGPVSRTPMGIIVGMMTWMYATARVNLAVAVTVLLGMVVALAVFTRRSWLSRHRSWITLYLASFTGILWAAFLFVTAGFSSWEASFILITVVGLNLIVHLLRFDRIDISLRAPDLLRG